jgi:hypothetical protein
VAAVHLRACLDAHEARMQTYRQAARLDALQARLRALERKAAATKNDAPKPQPKPGQV